MKKTILIDFDGVLNDYKGVYNEGNLPPIRKGAKEFLIKLSKEYIIKIFTSRTILKVSKWVIENEIEDYISDVTNIKEQAYVLIDDRGITFNGSFDELYKKIENFKVWYK